MNHEIIDLAKQFRLSVLHDGTFPIEEQHREYLLRLLQTEAAKREERSLAERLRQARFPAQDFYYTSL